MRAPAGSGIVPREQYRFPYGSLRERGERDGRGRAKHFVDSRALWGDPSFGQEGVCLSAAIWEKRSGEFFVAFVGLALVRGLVTLN